MKSCISSSGRVSDSTRRSREVVEQMHGVNAADVVEQWMIFQVALWIVVTFLALLDVTLSQLNIDPLSSKGTDPRGWNFIQDG